MADAAQLLSAVGALVPDLVIADVRMPRTHIDEGLRAALEIRARWPAVGVLVLSQYAEFTASLRRVAAGGTALLTAREREVLSLIAEGHSNSSIAQALVVSTGAVEKHVASIFGKLGLPPDDRSHRRVLAVLSYLREQG